jgi:hypothetical protein
VFLVGYYLDLEGHVTVQGCNILSPLRHSSWDRRQEVNHGLKCWCEKQKCGMKQRWKKDPLTSEDFQACELACGDAMACFVHGGERMAKAGLVFIDNWKSGRVCVVCNILWTITVNYKTAANHLLTRVYLYQRLACCNCFSISKIYHILTRAYVQKSFSILSQNSIRLHRMVWVC